VDTQPDITPLFLQIIHCHTAGLPTDATVKWTNLSQVQLAELLAQAGKPVSIPVVSQLLELHDFRPRQAYKTVAGGQHPDRDAQFRKIQELIRSYHAAGHPVLSMDVKQKELIGQFFRHGELYTQERVHVYDHDFRSLADGLVIPHGLYDLKHNLGYLTLGISRDTSAFAGDCIRHYWRTYGRPLYPHAHSLLILCDCGGSNNARWYVFKEQLQQVVNDLGIEIRVAHYPPYTSKYNPIEHRLFPHVSRACRGLVFSTIAVVTEAMSRATTKTGLHVFVSLLDKEYPAGNSATEGFKEHMEIVFDRELPQWNYRAIPSIA
jgi:hypothetical protein